ncbi:MAG: tRNA glutamyl-Q(34) synthetase GluQRS, partial [Nitrosospira sp.]|nr:tRNA glutamyl-Q(34) synthetase GluQRS [Nitrosospira sp.]
LGLPTPSYAHIPLVLERGLKLGKQTDASRLDQNHPARTLTAALEFLQQSVPTDLQNASIEEVWAWALEHWQLPAT